MGSGQSNQSPKQTSQSAPATARTTPKPRRNQQFQEVQLGQTGGTPKSRPTGRAQGSSPNPNPHQSTTQGGRTPRGNDPGASGGQSDRSTRPPQTQRQGAAANGRQRQNAMPSQQEKPQRLSYEELVNNTGGQESGNNAAAKGDNSGTVAARDNSGTVAANGTAARSHNSANPVTTEMVNGVDSSKNGSAAKGPVTSITDNKAKKKKNSVILVQPSRPIPGTETKQGQKKNEKNEDKNGQSGDEKVDGKSTGKPGIMKRSTIFRPTPKDVNEEKDGKLNGNNSRDKLANNEKENKPGVKSNQGNRYQGNALGPAKQKAGMKAETHGDLSHNESESDDVSNSMTEKVINGKDGVKSQQKFIENKTETKTEGQVSKKDEQQGTVRETVEDKSDDKPGAKTKPISGQDRGKKVSFAPVTESQVEEIDEIQSKNEVETSQVGNTEQLKNKATLNGNLESSSEMKESKEKSVENKVKAKHDNENGNNSRQITGSSQRAKGTKEEAQLDNNDINKRNKKLMDEKGYLNLAVLDKVADQIHKIQETRTDDQLSQLSYDDFYGDDKDSIGDASDLTQGPNAADPESEVGASQAGKKEADVLSMKEDDIVFETFYHRSGKEFQCIYQSGMRFYLDDWGSKEWQPFPKRWYNEGLLVTNTILRDEAAEQQSRNDQAGASGQGTSRSSQGRSGGQGGGGGGNDDREGFIMHPTRGRIPTYIFYKKHNVHMYFDRENGSWVRLPIGWELHHDMVKSLVDQVEEAVPEWGDRQDILALLRACNYDPDECISIYLHLRGDEWMKAPKTSKEAKGMADKDVKIQELEKKVRDLEIQLQKERQTREELERNLEESTNKMSEIEAESKQTEAQMSAMTGGRPKSARPVSVMMLAGKGKGGKGGKQAKPAGEVVNPEDVLDLNANAKELRKAHTKLKMEVERYFGDFKHIMDQVGPTVKKLKMSEKGTAAEIEEVRALYRKEALQRKLLYNQLQELRGNIRVFCRVRKDDRAENCLKYPSDQDIVATNQQGKKMFNFDKVFEPSSTQEQVFEDTKPIITSCADGYNVCLLAYGQTGSGKTFTMMGPDSNPGINIRAMKELFQVCKERAETMSYALTVSLVEIYNETIQDLLTSDAKTLELRTAGNKVNIPGLIEYPIKNVEDVKKVMAMGDSNRKVASTKMNSTSSRSHLVLMLAVEGKDKVTNAVSRGTLVLCDLAGSERISKTEAEGQRLVEAAAINKSLSALGQVFTALRTSQLHVPYRNSKLTQILQPSLGGDAKACLFVNVSPDGYNFMETVSTLTFGSNARQVALGQAKQNISKGKH